MDSGHPVFTAENECQDCCKCIRSCPVKAIKVENSRAAVIPELCIACGRCVMVCPAKAKKIRQDRHKVISLFKKQKPVYASLAPSYAGAFRQWTPKKLISALKKLGFTAVSETALGAEVLSLELSKQMQQADTTIVLSTACPAAVDFVVQQFPNLQKYLSDLASPMVAHSRLLRQHFGNDIEVVFIGPCVAKKKEADNLSNDISAAITFEELSCWLASESLFPESVEADSEANFLPVNSKQGAIYPVAGGMIETLHFYPELSIIPMMTLSGLDYIKQALSELSNNKFDQPLFVELLACEGGCVNGPGYKKGNSVIENEIAVRRYYSASDDIASHNYQMSFVEERKVKNKELNLYKEDDVLEALKQVGKYTKEDELNCGGCGYESCRNFAVALLDKRAETSMCLSYLRQQAQKKANALLRCMPAGVVIADSSLNIIECNEAFARLFGEDTLLGYNAKPGLKGAALEKIAPLTEIFQRVLETGNEYKNESLRVGNLLLSLTVFILEPGMVVGGIFSNVTNTELKRDQIAQKAKKVIEKNLSTVQEIACKLGEHMADTEILLRSIAEDYGSKETRKDKD